MRWAIALGWLLALAVVQAEAPMDLDSPFLKTALIEGPEGKREERTIRKAKLAGDSLEMETESGSLALFPKAQVIAILPRWPTTNGDFSSSDIEKALTFLQSLPATYHDRPEASPETLQKWRSLLPGAVQKDAEQAEERRQKEEARRQSARAGISSWVSNWADFRKIRTEEEIQGLRSQGQALLRDAPGEEKTVGDGLAFLAQWKARPDGSPLSELAKIEEVQAFMEPEDLVSWMGVGVWGISFFGFLVGLSFISSGLTRCKEGAWLGGVIFLPIGGVVLAGVAALWWPVEAKGKEVIPGLSVDMERLAVAAKNSVQPIVFFPAFSAEAGGEETAAGLLAMVPPSDEASGRWKARWRVGACWLDGEKWTYRQPFTVLGLPVSISLTFSGTAPSLAEWRQPVAEKVWLGRIPLPVNLGEMFFQSIVSSWGQAAERLGLGRLNLAEGAAGSIRLSLPASGKKPTVAAKVSAGKAGYRREISGEDLARAFLDGQGGEFTGKFIILDGVVEKVSSGSEFAGSSGVGDSAPSQPLKMGPDRFDVLYLRGADRYGSRGDPLFIRCVIRSPLVFAMDSYGDLFLGPAVNPIQDKPVVKKGYRVKFTQEGRVQSREIKNNEIEVYGIDVSSAEELVPYDPNQAPSP